MARRTWFVILMFAAAARAAPLRVGTITVRVTPLFSGAEMSRGGFYRAAEKMQINTRESLVRRFLLFHEGDELDEAKLRESERSLRQLDFLRSVSITAGPPHDGVVDVTVATEDAWTSDFNADYSNDGGQALYDFDVTQKNLFNRGGGVALRTEKGLFRHTNSIEVTDPELFGPYWNGDALMALSTDGHHERLSVERPLFSYATSRTALASFDHLLQNGRTFQDGEIATIFRQSHREAFLQAGRVIRSRPAAITRVLAGLDLIDDSFRAIQRVAPNRRRFRFLEIGVDRTRFNFITLDHVDFGVRKQDFNIGAHASVFVAGSPRRSRPGVLWRFRGDGSYGRTIGANTFLLTRATATIRLHGSDVKRNGIVSDDTRLIIKLPTVHPQTFVAHARVDIGWNLDRDMQFLADGQNFLRAYPNFSFAGGRRFIFNAEHRVFLGRELLQLFEPGVAGVLDTGEAVNGGFHGRDLRTDFGIGLRCGISRLESTMLRLDFGYAANRSPGSERGFEITFGTVQVF
jgi:hypothetical protein